MRLLALREGGAKRPRGRGDRGIQQLDLTSRSTCTAAAVQKPQCVCEVVFNELKTLDLLQLWSHPVGLFWNPATHRMVLDTRPRRGKVGNPLTQCCQVALTSTVPFKTKHSCFQE